MACLPFLGILVGVVFTYTFLATYTKTYYQGPLIKRGKMLPKDSLPPTILGGLLSRVELFWFGWTRKPAISWVPQALDGIPIGLGIVSIFMSGVVFLVDIYLMNANSAIAVNTFIRSAVAAGFPIFTPAMYERLGVDWATSLLAFICLAVCPFLFSSDGMARELGAGVGLHSSLAGSRMVSNQD